MSSYYFVVIEGARFKLGLRDRYSGLISVHPMHYLEGIMKENESRKGYDKVYSGFILLNWLEVSEEEWHSYEDHRLAIYKVEDTIASKNMEFPAEPNIHSDQTASSDVYVEDGE